jgi:hypothetical protein
LERNFSLVPRPCPTERRARAADHRLSEARPHRERGVHDDPLGDEAVPWRVAGEQHLLASFRVAALQWPVAHVGNLLRYPDPYRAAARRLHLHWGVRTCGAGSTQEGARFPPGVLECFLSPGVLC